jgi:filamin
LIEDISKDFSDGLKLITFLEVISSKDDWSKKRDKAPKMRIQKIQNVDLCMKFLKAEGVKLVAIQAESEWFEDVLCFVFTSRSCNTDIVDGDLTLILGMIWTIIQQYQIADISEEGACSR